ncbi:MAG: hypothetical protein DLM68_10730 [Hyphomicrobiales bacterium]|nr:MAG: hypothetical protein DLM68_10730 [Hyphomicrobiales bacterium]
MKRAARLSATLIALLASLTMARGQTAAPAPDASPSPALPASPTPPAPTATSIPSPTMDIINSAKVTDTGVNDGVSPAIVRAEVMLDRVHASLVVIDGRDGENFVHALEIYEKAKGLKITKGLDDNVWSSLLAETGGPVLMEYVLTDQNVEGPFFPNLPKDYGELAKLKAIGYRSPSQKIGAMFHMGEDLLATLNHGIDLSKAGTKILVAEVKPQPIHGALKTIVVDKKKSQVLGYDRKGHVLVAYPATIGSRELPSPSGTYKVKGVAYNPIYYYDPDKNFEQGDNKEKLRLPPGPNNPVGSVFIALTKPTYGLHGTPDPSKIDKSASHGCVRMTNWAANELAHLVKRGIVVRFKS